MSDLLANIKVSFTEFGIMKEILAVNFVLVTNIQEIRIYKSIFKNIILKIVLNLIATKS